MKNGELRIDRQQIQLYSVGKKREGQPDRKMVKAEEEDKGEAKLWQQEGNVIIADADWRAILESGNVKLKEEEEERVAKRGITDRSDDRQADERGRQERSKGLPETD